jgi:outer membrane lipoprotein-sorting protein
VTGELDLVRLLYRADWTRLSLTAEVRGMLDGGVLARQDEAQRWFARAAPPGPAEVQHFRARLLVAPGGRYHAEADGDRDEFNFRNLRAADLPDGFFPPGTHDADHLDASVQTWLRPRYKEMLRPVSLLTGFVLALRGPVTFAGREAHHVVATPSPSAAAITPGLRPLDRVEVLVDAETGILLRREEIFGGQVLRFTEFTSARFGALEAADAARFAPDPESGPAGEAPGRDPFEGFEGIQGFDGAGWQAAKTAVDAAGAVLGTAIRLTPGGSGPSGPGNADDPEAAIPDDDPFPAGWADEDPPPAGLVSDQLLHALTRAGSAPFTGVYHHWTDLSALTADFTSAASRHGWTGISTASRAFSDRAGAVHKASRVRFGTGGRYRIDMLHETGKGNPTSTGCDGEQRWRMYSNRVTVGPAGPLSDHVLAALADASWLLRYQLSGETELTYRGRPAFAVQVEAGDYPALAPTGVMLTGARAIIDAEAGIVLLLVSAQGGRPALRSELGDVTVTSDEDDAAFRFNPPPGLKVVPVSGNLLEEVDVPDAVRTAARTAGQAARAAERGVTAAKGFFDFLRERR